MWTHTQARYRNVVHRLLITHFISYEMSRILPVFDNHVFNESFLSQLHTLYNNGKLADFGLAEFVGREFSTDKKHLKIPRGGFFL